MTNQRNANRGANQKANFFGMGIFHVEPCLNQSKICVFKNTRKRKQEMRFNAWRIVSENKTDAKRLDEQWGQVKQECA